MPFISLTSCSAIVLILHFFTVNTNTSVRTYNSARCTTNTIVRSYSLGVLITMHVHCLCCESNDIFRASYNTKRASFAPVGVNHDSTFDFSHSNMLFRVRGYTYLYSRRRTCRRAFALLPLQATRVESYCFEIVVDSMLPIAFTSVLVAELVIVFCCHTY